MSDDTEPEGRLLNFPPPGGVLDRPPDLADPGRLFPAPAIPPESPEETTMELPVTPAAPDPLNSLRSEGIPLADPESNTSGEFGEDGEGEYVQPRSLADRLGDWLEYRIEMGRARLESEAPFREAEIARKVALLESQTARETGLMDAQNKLRQAHLKAGADRAGARGKADASAAGFGSDKGRGKPGSPARGSGGGAGRSGGSGRGGGSTGPGGSPGRGTGGASGRGPGGGNSPKSSGKGPDRRGGGRANGPKGHESPGGSKGRQNGSGGVGSGRGNAGKGSPGGSGSGRDRGANRGAKRDGGRTPASSPTAERARGRQERAAARQSARQQRAAARQAAGLSDRSRDRDRDREARQAARDRSERRADKSRRRQEKTERKEQQRKRQQAARERAERTGFGEALAEEAQRRWDKRRPSTDGGPKEASGGEAKERKERTQKKEEGKPESGDGGGRTEGKSEPGDNSRSDIPPDGASESQAPGGPEYDDPEDDGRGPYGWSATDRDGKRWTWTAGGWRRRTSYSTRGSTPGSPFGRDRTPPTPEWADGRPNRPADTEPESTTDIWDAVIVDDEGDPFRSYAARRPGLPRAPRQRPTFRTTEIKRPGTSRPAPAPAAPDDGETPSPGAVTPQNTEEHRVAHTPAPRTPAASGPLPAQHQTDITFEQYLIEAVNLAVAAGADKEEAIELAKALEKVADALRDMSSDLAADHAIDTRVTALIADLADAADQMKKDATQCATESGMACEAAVTVAGAVGLVYGQDQQAMQDARLAHTSAAAHH
ncbi:ATP/GTP-binding protein [Streptomyces sp. NPDC057456]|uniref:ATP/GTP-binding protein n=1 Tax=Streptomyces sp. NPDC057456 TaxID=3346139 RepID=UPI0036A3EE69